MFVKTVTSLLVHTKQSYIYPEVEQKLEELESQMFGKTVPKLACGHKVKSYIIDKRKQPQIGQQLEQTESQMFGRMVPNLLYV